MTISNLKKELGLSNADIAKIFGFKNTIAYTTSSAKKRYETALCDFYELIKEHNKRISTIDSENE